MSEGKPTATDEGDLAEEIRKQDAEEPMTGAPTDGPTSSDQVGEKPLIAPGKSDGSL